MNAAFGVRFAAFLALFFAPPFFAPFFAAMLFSWDGEQVLALREKRCTTGRKIQSTVWRAIGKCSVFPLYSRCFPSVIATRAHVRRTHDRAINSVRPPSTTCEIRVHGGRDVGGDD